MRAASLDHTLEGPADAPALLLCNSLGSTRAMWDATVPSLRGHFRLVRFELRGHGHSESPPGPWDVTDLGSDVLRLMDDLSLSRAHVAGLSLGGMVAMWMAINAPERVDRLVLCCTSARLGPVSQWVQRAQAVLAGGTEAVADAVVERWVTPEWRQAHPEEVQRLRAMVAAAPARGYAECCGVIERLDLQPLLGAISAPTLVIATERDPSTPPEHARCIAAGVAGSRLEILPDGAHMATVEQPAAVGALIAEHLA